MKNPIVNIGKRKVIHTVNQPKQKIEKPSRNIKLGFSRSLSRKSR